MPHSFERFLIQAGIEAVHDFGAFDVAFGRDLDLHDGRSHDAGDCLASSVYSGSTLLSRTGLTIPSGFSLSRRGPAAASGAGAEPGAAGLVPAEGPANRPSAGN